MVTRFRVAFWFVLTPHLAPRIVAIGMHLHRDPVVPDA